MHVRMLVRIDAMLLTPRLMHLRMRVRTASIPPGCTCACVCAPVRQGDDPPAPARPQPLWRNGFLAFLAQSALTSHLFGLGRRARL